jgi:hypothetical protein
MPEAVPAGQGAHVVELTAAGWLLKVFGGHGVTFVVPTGVKEPRAQQRAEPGALYRLLGHASEQVSWPMFGLYLPAAQLTQDDWPVLGLYLPCEKMARG